MPEIGTESRPHFSMVQGPDDLQLTLPVPVVMGQWIESSGLRICYCLSQPRSPVSDSHKSKRETKYGLPIIYLAGIQMVQSDRGLLESQPLQKSKWNMSRTRLNSSQTFSLLSGMCIPPLSLSRVLPLPSSPCYNIRSKREADTPENSELKSIRCGEGCN